VFTVPLVADWWFEHTTYFLLTWTQLPSERVWWPSKQPTVNRLNTPSLLLIMSFSQLQWKVLVLLTHPHQVFV